MNKFKWLVLGLSIFMSMNLLAQEPQKNPCAGFNSSIAPFCINLQSELQIKKSAFLADFINVVNLNKTLSVQSNAGIGKIAAPIANVPTHKVTPPARLTQ